jgi:hypothetical protein
MDSRQKAIRVRIAVKRARIEPYVMFCLHLRPQLREQHPEKTSSEITSCLGQLWKHLPAHSKEFYHGLARRVINDPAPVPLPRVNLAFQIQPPLLIQALASVEVAIAPPIPGTTTLEVEVEGPSSSPAAAFVDLSAQAQVKLADPPALWIIPRGNSGHIASLASLRAFRTQAFFDQCALPGL